MSCAVPEVGVTMIYDPAAMTPPPDTPPKGPPPSYEVAIADESEPEGLRKGLFDDPKSYFFCPRPQPPSDDRASRQGPFAPFGAREWKIHFGVDVGVEPPVPDEYDTYLRRQDPIDRAKQVWQTHHFLVLVPASFTMDGVQFPYNAKTMQLLFSEDRKQPMKGVVEYIVEQDCIEESEKASQWVLMRKRVVCRQEPYEKMNKMIRTINKAEKVDYQVPHLRQAVSVVMAVFARMGIRPLSAPMNPEVELESHLTYTVVKEAVKKGFFSTPLPLMVGGFGVDQKLWVEAQEKAFVREQGDCTVGVAPIIVF